MAFQIKKMMGMFEMVKHSSKNEDEELHGAIHKSIFKFQKYFLDNLEKLTFSELDKKSGPKFSNCFQDLSAHLKKMSYHKYVAE